MEKRPSYYTIIPADVRYDNELTPIAKLLFSEILSLSIKNGYCYATNNYLAELYGINLTTVRRAIALLVKKNYITSQVQYKDKKIVGRHLKVSELVWAKMPIGIGKNAPTSMGKNAPYNNINNNNINNNIYANKFYSDKVVNFNDYYANL